MNNKLFWANPAPDAAAPGIGVNTWVNMKTDDIPVDGVYPVEIDSKMEIDIGGHNMTYATYQQICSGKDIIVFYSYEKDENTLVWDLLEKAEAKNINDDSPVHVYTSMYRKLWTGTYKEYCNIFRKEKLMAKNDNREYVILVKGAYYKDNGYGDSSRIEYDSVLRFEKRQEFLENIEFLHKTGTEFEAGYFTPIKTRLKLEIEE